MHRVAHDSHAHADVPDADAVIDQAAASRRVPRVNIAGSQLELECRRNAVPSLKAVSVRRLLVGVQIDESRTDDETHGIDGGAAGQAIGRGRRCGRR